MASFGIGAKLRQERVGKGLSIDDISRDTRIATRFLEAIETDDFARLPGLVFTRNFVKQYALTLKLDPDPMLAELPTQDESTVRLPEPPVRSRSSYHQDRRLRSIVSSLVWLVLAGGAGYAGYMAVNHSVQTHASAQREAAAPVPPENPSSPPARDAVPDQQPAVEPVPDAGTAPAVATAAPATPAPVQVSLTAHAPAWVQVSADGKTTYTGTLQPNETREVAASAQVKISTGNAGALTISLNGKTLDSLGPIGQVRVVKLTAEGPELLSKAPPPAPDPL